MTPAFYAPLPRYVNAWLDWNRDGGWADVATCPGGVPAPEWAVRDQVLALGPGFFALPSLPFVTCLHFVENRPFETWLRLSVAEMPAPAPYDGRGPLAGYDLGETEDYHLHLFADLSKAATAPAELQPGTLVTYHLTYAALGNILGAGAVISDVLPAGIEYVSSNPAGFYHPPSRTVSWGVALVPGAPSTIDLVATYTGSVGRVTNTAALLWSGVVWRRSSATVENLRRVYLPIVVRAGP